MKNLVLMGTISITEKTHMIEVRLARSTFLLIRVKAIKFGEIDIDSGIYQSNDEMFE